MDLKKKLLDNKTRLIQFSLFFIILSTIGIFIFIFTSLDNNKVGTPFDGDIQRASHILYNDNINDSISLYDFETKKVVSTVSVKTPLTKFSSHSDLSGFYGYDGKDLYDFTISNNRIETSLVANINKDIISFSVNENYVAYLNGVELFLLNLNDKKEIKLASNIYGFTLTNDFLTYYDSEHIYSYNLKTLKTSKIEIGDSTRSSMQKNDSLILLNNFGSKNNKSLLLNLDPSNLDVSSAITLDSPDFFKTLNSSDDDTIYLYNNKDNLLLSAPSDLSKTSSFKLKDKINSDLIFGVNGYLYYLFENSIHYLTVGGQQTAEKLDIANNYFVPLFLE